MVICGECGQEMTANCNNANCTYVERAYVQRTYFEGSQIPVWQAEVEDADYMRMDDQGYDKFKEGED